MSSLLAGYGSKKRKRNDVSTQIGFANTPDLITLQASGDVGDPQAPRVELKPKLLVPRDYLSFTFTNRDRDTQPCFFKASIGVLTQLDSEHYGIPKVLIATSTIDNALFAVEKVGKEEYSLCPLHDWVALDELESRPAKIAKPNVKPRAGQAEAGAWWDRAAVSRTAMEKLVSTKSSSSGRRIPKLCMKPAFDDKLQKGDIPRKEAEGKSKASTDITPPNLSGTEPSLELTPDAVSAALRAKYLESLYISNTSLAYFAKGPLARARNILKRPMEDGSSQALLDVLHETIIRVPVGDKKYTTTLPDLIKEVPVGMLNDDLDMAKHVEAICKKGKKRKTISRGGLLPSEEQHVLRWWQEKEGHPDSINAVRTHGERIKANLTKQRTRETQLQILIILEAMIAENVAKESTAKSTTEQEGQGDATKKSKKPVDLQSLLDIHVDRLCIWQTTQNEFDAELLELRPRSSHKSGPGDRGNALQDFCTEVLVPFFASRIPHTFAQLCKKMGTVGVASPVRPITKNVQLTTKSQSKPGASVSRRSLQRVATEGANGRRKPPTLSRSATDSVAVRMKREDSELILAEIPVHKPRPQPNLRHTQREVDLDALSKATEAKLRRKALIEEELKSAINVLKKPNSRMAVKEYADSSDGRYMTNSKRKREPTQLLTAPGPQVKATPRAKRVRSDLLERRERSPDAYFVPPSDQVIPSSSRRDNTSRRVSSYLAAEGTDDMRIQTTPSRRGAGPPFLDHVHNTSSNPLDTMRRRERLDPSLLVEDHAGKLAVDASPTAMRRPPMRITETPTKPTKRFLAPPTFPTIETGADTSVKASTRNDHFIDRSEPQATKQVAIEVEEDIDVYKALGWDDEGDDL